ncbi:hypothetical protein PMZ80_003421 [Knufia obscura]|uniref:WD40 repeat-like protein n=1 Tax=Knufia obscura TaxID=1635080 RepID=A0ABR0RU62_9EURO|nr:hypothetical protein PMZ80_003421 [Knufia obscura]
MGGIWSVGGRVGAVPQQIHGIDSGTGETLASGSNAPMINAAFLEHDNQDTKVKAHEARLALAMDIDQAQRGGRRSSFDWKDNAWSREHTSPTRVRTRSQPSIKPEKAVPSVAFRVLDAPRLKDDFYCSVLAYCYTCRTLAVALTHRVYLWTEAHGVRYPPLAPARAANYVTSLAFSSIAGGKSILAVARNSGHVALWSLFEQKTRFELPHPWAACSVAWRPTVSYRQTPGRSDIVACEDLLVGDDSGCLYYYSVHWPDFAAGHAVLLTKLDAHSQNICGLAWSPDGKTFTSGGNDNSAVLFDTEAVLKGLQAVKRRADIDTDEIYGSGTSDVVGQYLTPPQSPERVLAISRVPSQPYITGQHPMIEHFGMLDPVVSTFNVLTPPQSPERTDRRGRSPERLPRSFNRAVSQPPSSGAQSQQNLENQLANPGIDGRQSMHKKSFYHSAAVKAIAYAPWQPTLLATGGGSNDRQIHFHHTESGSTLAVINVFAQVTSLAWSSTSREIVATFGYAQPEHDIRIAVFAWPSCECVVSIPWERKANGEIGRALWAIPYPGGPNDAAADAQEEEANIGFQA